MTIILAFLAGMIVLPINLAAGHVADKSYNAVWLQMIIAPMWCLGVNNVVHGWWPCLAYIAGGVTAAALSIMIRRKWHKH